MFVVVFFVVIAIIVLVVVPWLLMALTVPLKVLARLLDATARGLNAWNKRQGRRPAAPVRSSVRRYGATRSP